MIKHYNLTVTGRVQGVGYRYNCMRKAKDMNITGFVRNRPDGSVYIEAEAEAQVLERFILWCEDGPPAAIVKRVHKSESPVEIFKGFNSRF